MRILFVAAEAVPFAKVGGLADVIGSLPAELRGFGDDVRVLIPDYGFGNTGGFAETRPVSFNVVLPGGIEQVSLTGTQVENRALYYLLRHAAFSTNEVYTGHDTFRFFLFCQAVSRLLPQLDWQPQIVHCHDWHTALIPRLLKEKQRNYRSVFTIHNLAYQGSVDDSFLRQPGIRQWWSSSPPGAPASLSNFMSLGILWADVVTTVSETYACEITTPEFGLGLDNLLRHRRTDLIGIVNGIDEREFDPASDALLSSTYDSATLTRKTDNKLQLQRQLGLTVNGDIPLVGMVQRLEEQKGIDILVRALPRLLELDLQFVIQGRGRPHYEEMVRNLARKNPNKIASIVEFDNKMAHRIYAGADMFLMPSRFEPCGLGQLIAMKYGTIPVVRRTGGLAETVADVNSDLSEGTGFVFNDYDDNAIVWAVGRAMASYRNQEAWQKLARRVMMLDWSWKTSASKYSHLYLKLMEGRTNETG